MAAQKFLKHFKKQGCVCISYLDIQIVKLILNRVELMRLLSMMYNKIIFRRGYLHNFF